MCFPEQQPFSLGTGMSSKGGCFPVSPDRSLQLDSVRQTSEKSQGFLALLFCCVEFLSKETVLTKEPNKTTLATAGHWPVFPKYSPQTAILGAKKTVFCPGPQLLQTSQSLHRESRGLDTMLGYVRGSLYGLLTLTVSIRFCLTRHLLQEACPGSSNELMAPSPAPITLGSADYLFIGTFGANIVPSASLSLAPAVNLLDVKVVPQECSLNTIDGH